MELTRTSTVEQVAQVLVATLGIAASAGGLAAETPLFGSMPELDSMAVVEVIVALQEHFGVQIDEEDITGETFETVGSLAALVDARIG
jgi:acyl carrier protein